MVETKFEGIILVPLRISENTASQTPMDLSNCIMLSVYFQNWDLNGFQQEVKGWTWMIEGGAHS